MLAQAGASVTMVSRSRERAEEAIAEVNAAANGGTIDFEEADMADLESVRKLATRLSTKVTQLDALVLNAGVLLHERVITSDGIELAWATNVVGQFLLEQLLLPQLQEAHGRVVMVTSGGAYSEALALPAIDLEGESYDGPAVYARTKRAQIALAELQSAELADLGVTVHAVHPGWADTPGVQESLPTFRKFTRPFLRTADQGADSIAWLALADEPVRAPGLLWHDRAPRPRNRIPGQRESEGERSELQAELRRLSGLTSE
jgi:NAD(P)-dependent dehydrogenase (short-subunit alcohol dehydrogenase family)